MKPSERGARAASTTPRERRRADTEALANPRPWFLTGFATLGVAAFLGAMRAAPNDTLPPLFHVVLAVAGLFLVAGGLAHGFAPPFLKRETYAPRLALAPPAVVAAAGVGALVASPWLDARTAMRVLMAGVGAAMLLTTLHVGLSALAGRPWRGGVALFAKDQPFRRGDGVAAALFGVALLGFTAAAVAFLAPPRGLPNVGVVLALLMGLHPFFAGVLVFLLPRNAKQPLPGATLATAALVFLALGAAALAFAFARPVNADFRFPAAAASLALALFGLGMLRVRFPEKPGPQLMRARPMLSGALVVAGLSAIVLPLALAGDVPNELIGLALYLHLTLAALLASGAALLGAPILLNAVPREGRWAAWSASLAILGLFLLAPSFQYPRPAFPGAAVLFVAALVLLYGVWPMRKPRREC